MIILGILGKYPFLNQRTSHFLLLLTVAVAAVGVGSLAAKIPQRLAPAGPIFLIGTLTFVAYVAAPYVGSRSIPPEDVRTQTQYVEANISPGDTILINLHGSFGFAYYWDSDDPLFLPTDIVSHGFVVAFSRPDILVASGRSRLAAAS